jgi:amidohydrolase
MDALPIQEATGVEYASQYPGRMHACGHDAHMATALGLARHYTTGRAELPCRLRLIFQPGEEGWAGARHMIDHGAMEGVDAIGGLHVGCIFPEMPLGCFGLRKGTVMASSTFFRLTLRGKGAHGAMPHLGSDPLLAACHLVASLQGVRYGAASPVNPTVISIGSIHSGTADNIIPELAEVGGSFRTTGQGDQAGMVRHLERHAQGIAAAHGVEVEIDASRSGPEVRVDPALADLLADAVMDAHGPENFMWLADPTLAGEDFGFYLQHAPGFFFFLGTNPEGCDFPHHHPQFQVADEVLWKAVPVVDGFLRRWARG